MRMKPSLNIGLDLDGVLYPIEYDFERMIQNEVDSNFTVNDMTTWEFYKDFGLSTLEFNRMFAKYINNEEMFITQDPYPGVSEAIWKLHRMGHKLHIVTHRETPSAETASMLLTHAWLAKQKWPLKSVTIAEDKAIIQTDIFLDDAVHNLERLNSVSIAMTGVSNAVCMNRLWNSDWKGLRINKFTTLVDLVSSLEEKVNEDRK